MLCRDHFDGPEHLRGSGRRRFVLIEDAGGTLKIHQDEVRLCARKVIEPPKDGRSHVV
ncbi:hypothetical protein [Bradyrhizobium sp. RDM12]